jgi:pyruvate kinase
MLSGETTTGLYPFKAVEAMARTLQKNESGETSFDHLITPILADKVDIDLPRKEQCLAAAVLATKLHADAMIVMSRHGRTARAVSRCRPHVPIHTFADTESVQRKMMLVWGVIPHVISFVKESEKNIKKSIELLKKEKYLKKGMRVVIVSDMSSTGEPVMSIQIRTIE